MAIGMAVVCAVHCLVTPVLLIALPTSFFVHENFHLWMLLLVLPTTGFAVFMGCRKHRDKWVGILSALGLFLLVFVVADERLPAATGPGHDVVATEHHCEVCAATAAALEGQEGATLPANAWINTLGGLFLAGGHIRNFRLCRKRQCEDC